MNECTGIGNEYFSLLARTFPVMCASDEFHFLPRVQQAGRFLHRLDDLSQSTIGDTVAAVHTLQSRLSGRQYPGDFEKEIDRQLLLHNMAGLLLELEDRQSWRHNPLLYLKVACIGVDQALSKPAGSPEERLERTAERLRALGRLLAQAGENLKTIPAEYYSAALAMAADARQYLGEIGRRVEQAPKRVRLGYGCWEAQKAVAGFAARLQEIGPAEAEAVPAPEVEHLVRQHFGSFRSLQEIYAIAQEEWRCEWEEMEKLRQQADPSRSWRQIYESFLPGGEKQVDLFRLYGAEVVRLRQLCLRLKLLEDREDQEVVLEETPIYLRSVRSGASYCSPLGTSPEEPAIFYLSTTRPDGRGRADIALEKRLHREHRFLAAHETYPGHHFLDNIRRRLDNPVRRQVESPLFYEGWAYYAEAILSESGYLSQPLERLVDCKRRLWRAGRCLIDAGLALGGLRTVAAAADLLVSLGFSPAEAKTQVARFRLNPGYQLCYSLGKYEIIELRRRFVPLFGWERFHRLLLEGGELPFHLAGWRFEKLREPGQQGRRQADSSSQKPGEAIAASVSHP